MGAEPSSRLEGKIPAGWLPLSHAEAINAIEQLVLTAFCDVDEERTARLAKLYNITNIFSNYEMLAEQCRPEFVCIATRTQGRVDIIQHFCNAGAKIIYAEKPLANSITSCKAAIASVADNNVLLGYGVNRRYHAAYRMVKEIITSGKYGKLSEITIENGRTNLLWTHPHSVDTILFFAQSTEVEWVSGNCSFSASVGPDDLSIDDDPVVEHACFVFRNGIKATITTGGGWNVRLHCAGAVITIYSDGSWIEICEYAPNGYLKEPMVMHADIKESATITAFRELLAAYQTGSALPVANDEIVTGMSMLAGIVFSALHGGKKIAYADIPADLYITGKSGSFYA